MTTSSPKWKLIDLDTNQEYQGSFPSQDNTVDAGTTYSETWTLGREDPILQWTHGKARTYTFRVRLWAADSTKFIKWELDTLEAAIKRDPELGRPHIFRYVNGTMVNVRCVIDSIGGINFDSLRNDGSPRGASLTITLRKYEAFDIELTDPDAPPTSTRYYRLAQGETFEHAAAALYGNASLGDLIRRRNPSVTPDTVNQLVVAPEAKDIQRERLEPYSPPLVRTAAHVALRDWMFARFSNRTYVAKVLHESV